MATGSANSAKIWAVIGASGTGKGLWIKQQLAELQPPRLVCWDFKNEYGDYARPMETLDGIRRAMLKAGAGPLRVRYLPRGAGEKNVRREFEALCELVYAFGQCVFIAEELSNVTTPGWAPAAWRKMTTSGRHEAVHIIGATQNPALVDKTFLGNCTLVHVCALREYPHRMYIARSIDAPLQSITDLQQFEWIERDYDTGQLRAGMVVLPGTAATVTKARATATGDATACKPQPAPIKSGSSVPGNTPSPEPTQQPSKETNHERKTLFRR
jgi:hypothetical protein